MPVSDSVVSLVCDLSPVELSPRKMFGGVGLYQGDQMVALLYDDRLYVKAVSAAAQQRHAEAGMGPFRPNDRQTFGSFYEVPPEALESPEALATWLTP